MPANVQGLLLLLVFIAPGFVFVEAEARRRPAQQVGAFDKAVASILFSTVLHAFLLWPIVLCLFLFGFDFTNLADRDWLLSCVRDYAFWIYSCVLLYFVVCIGIAVFFATKVGVITRRWTPVLFRIVRRDQANHVLVHVKSGDFYTGILGMIPADYDVLQGPAKDFTIVPPGRYKPNGKRWQKLQEGEVVLLNTSNVDAIRIM